MSLLVLLIVQFHPRSIATVLVKWFGNEFIAKNQNATTILQTDIKSHNFGQKISASIRNFYNLKITENILCFH